MQIVLPILVLGLIISLAAGYRRGILGGGADTVGVSDATSEVTPVEPAEPMGPVEGVPWQPFDLQPGQYFKYEVINHMEDTRGWVSVRVAEAPDGKLEAIWEGERDDGERLSVTVTAKPERLTEDSHPAVITSPVAPPFLATILNAWWGRLAGFEWQVGAQWTVMADAANAPAGFTVKVDGHCSVGDRAGYQGRMVLGKTNFVEGCVSPLLPLPLSAVFNDLENNPRFEARLLEYRSTGE